MSRYFTMHPDNPQPRLLKQAVDTLRAGEIIAYPTDSAYAFGWAMDNKPATEMVRNVRGLSPSHPMTLICKDISQAASYASIDDANYRLIKRCTPGAYTFILPALKTVPRLLQGGKRRTVGIRIPDCKIALGLAEALGDALLSATLWLKDDSHPLYDPHEIPHSCAKFVNLVLDGGEGDKQATSVIDLTGNSPKVIREGKGDITEFLE